MSCDAWTRANASSVMTSAARSTERSRATDSGIGSRGSGDMRPPEDALGEDVLGDRARGDRVSSRGPVGICLEVERRSGRSGGQRRTEIEPVDAAPLQELAEDPLRLVPIEILLPAATLRVDLLA